jgi:outer membrane protein TolC
MALDRTDRSRALPARRAMPRRVRAALAGFVLFAVTKRDASAATLEECVRLALARAPGVQAAALDVVAAAARVRAARGAYAAKLSARGEYGVSGGFDLQVTNGGSTAALLSFEATLLDGGLRRADLAGARARLQAAEAVDRQQRSNVAFAVRSTYVAAISAWAEASIHADASRSLRDYVGVLERLEARGIVPLDDLLRSRLAEGEAEAERRGAQSDAETQRGILNLLTGAELQAADLAEPEAMRISTPTDDEIDEVPSVADARASAEAAEHDVEAARSELGAQVKLTGDAGVLGVRPRTAFRDDAGGQFLVALSVPLFDGGVAAGRIAAAQAAASSARARLEAARLTVRLDLERAGAAAEKAQADAVAARDSVPIASDHFELTRARYLGGGNVRLLEVLDALTVYRDSRLRVPRALLAYRLAVATEQQLVGDTGR